MSNTCQYLDENGFVDFLHIFSYNAIFNFIDSVRNTGKTTKAKAIALIRFLKKKKKCLWIRTFEEDVKDLKKNFYNNKVISICKKMGYDVKLENIYQDGKYIYYVDPKTNKKTWFIKIVHLSMAQSLKGNEIEEIDLIVYDEYRTKANRINRYIGNPAKDFIDIVYSIARSHYVKTLLLGNKETFNNPFYDYMKIVPPQDDFQGIKTYNNGSILICQINQVPSVIENNQMQKKLKDALKFTPIYNYLYNGQTEGVNMAQIKKTPSNAIYGCGFKIQNSLFSVWYGLDGNVYFKSKIDPLQHIYCDTFTNKYRYAELIHRDDKKHFKLIVKANKYNKIYFENVGVAERVQVLFKYLGI